MRLDDPAFWRAGAISTVAIMSVVLIMLTIDSLAVISPGGANVPLYTVINRHIDYKFDAKRGNDVPAIGAPQPLFGKSLRVRSKFRKKVHAVKRSWVSLVRELLLESWLSSTAARNAP